MVEIFFVILSVKLCQVHYHFPGVTLENKDRNVCKE